MQTPVMPWNQDASNFRCLDCGLVFTTEEAIETHIQKAHAQSAFLSSGSEPEMQQAALPEVDDGITVMDWMEEGTMVEPVVPEVPVYNEVPAYAPGNYRSFPPGIPASPHDFRPPGLSPQVVVEYFCKVCGEIVPRLRFCTHISSHFADIYLPRTNEPPRCIISDFVQQGSVQRRPAVRKEDCQTCAQGGPMVLKLRQTLASLAEVFS